MAIHLDLNAEADAGRAVARLGSGSSAGPVYPWSFQPRGYLPSPTCQAGRGQRPRCAAVGVGRQMLPRPWGFLRGPLGVPRWRMPAKGRYFLNEGEEGPDQDALYEKYRLTSQHGPLLLMLLLVAIAACTTLIIITFSYGVSGGSPWLLGLPWGPGLSSDALYL